MAFYFEKFENRRPPEPVAYRPGIELLWQFFAVIALVLGANYISWRWLHSLNPEALWFSIPLAFAETCAYFGLILFTFNLWKTRDRPQLPPPHSLSDCVSHLADADDRPISVDLFIATYNEDEELVRLSIKDAKKVTYPHAINYIVHVLDDGRRDSMRTICEEENVNYISRDNNIGFKAGNLRNAMEITQGDFIVICDADTRVFPSILSETLGYFRDPDVAWVQTPQWFYDIPEGRPLPIAWQRRLGKFGYYSGCLIEKIFGPIRVGHDPFVNDPQMFYDLIQRRRNWANAAFCCGAGSIHRRDAVMQSALRAYGIAIENEVSRHTKEIRDPELREELSDMIRQQVALETELTPYKFHVSEDIYTSIVLHADPDRQWKSVLHPNIVSKMLSPQDLQSWMVQRFKYAGGTIDIALRDNPILFGKLSWPQKIMYLTTFWSYFGCLWNFIFLISPTIYLVTGISPVSAYSTPFYWHFLPFIIMTELAFMFGTWGVSAWKGKASYLSFFAINFSAIANVLRGEKIKFPVTPKDRQEGTFLHLVYPQVFIIVLTSIGLFWGATKLALGVPMDTSGFIINIFWGLNNIAAMLPLVMAAFWQPDDEQIAADSESQTLSTLRAS
jgi:cellulose synthase (UDP-forming)